MSNPSPVPYTIVVPTAYGHMLVNRHDINQANALLKTGASPSHPEVALIVQLLQLLGGHRLTAIDVGANFGSFTLAMARAVGPGGRVHAFEAQRIIFQMLAGSVALNSLTNVHCHNLAIGARTGRVEIPQYDYGRPLNFGSVEFTANQREPLDQQRGHDPEAVEHVPVATLDQFEYPRVDLIKIDVEGMENDVLDGAAATIQRCRPVMYVEYTKVGADALRERLAAPGYDVYLNAGNFLAVPTELAGRLRVTPTPPT